MSTTTVTAGDVAVAVAVAADGFCGVVVCGRWVVVVVVVVIVIVVVVLALAVGAVPVSAGVVCAFLGRLREDVPCVCDEMSMVGGE